MIKVLSAISLSFGLSFLAFAEKSEVSNETMKSEWKMESDGSIKTNLNFGIANQAENYTIGVESPSFLTHTNKYQTSKMGVYLDLRFIRIRNLLASKTSGKLSDSVNSAVSFGMVNRHFHKEDFAVFVKLGASQYILDKAITEHSTHWGFRFELGGERLFVVPWLLGSKGEIKESLFSSVSYDFVKAEADKIAGSPQFFKGLAINFGLRSFF